MLEMATTRLRLFAPSTRRAAPVGGTAHPAASLAVAAGKRPANEIAACRDRVEGEGPEMNRRLGVLLLFVVVLCSIAAGIWYYRSKCWGMDQCAAAEAESHERDKPREAQ